MERRAPTVELRSCSKRFGERVALRRVTLAVASGETVVLLGANGSGKSTLLRLVAGLSWPTAGEALIDGVQATRLATRSRGALGYLGHRTQSWRGLTARENLAVLARLHGLNGATVLESLAAVGLADRADDRVDGFSRGMLQRLAIGRAVLHDPTLVLADEPTTGLDGDGLGMLDALLAARRGRATVLVATHDEAFAARHADRVVRLQAGELVP
jgi:heme exporter protein A